MSYLSLWIDESEREPLLALGGVIVEWSAVVGLVQQWRAMKVSVGLRPDSEVKWNLPRRHQVREDLARAGLLTRDLLAKAVQCLASLTLSMSFIVIAMFDKRRMDWWKIIWPKASARDFYCEALKYTVQRAAEEVTETGASGCVVICDTPELGTREFAGGSIRRGRKAVEKEYAQWYEQGVGVGPGRQHHRGALKSVGFHPSIFVADATYHDVLQIVDVAVGVTRE